MVDDNPEVSELFASVLTDAGYEVLCAANGKQALQQLGSDDIDLMVTDLVMPDMEGLELIRECQSIKPKLKIIAVSGAFDGSYLRVAKLYGAKHALLKPVSPATLVHAVQTVLAFD